MYKKPFKKISLSLLSALLIAGSATGAEKTGVISNINKDDERMSSLPLILGDKMLRLSENVSKKDIDSCSGLIVLRDDGKISQQLTDEIKDFAAKGNTVFMDIKSFAAMNDIKTKVLDVIKESNSIEIESPATRGFKAQDSFPVMSENGQMNVISRSDLEKCGAETLVAVDKNYSSFVRKKEGNGFIYAVDILSVGEPYYKDPGSFYKYLSISNLFVNPVRYGEYYSKKMTYSELVTEMKRISEQYPELTFQEEGSASGNFKIYSLNIGNPDAPMFFMYAATHGWEWEPGYGLITFAKRLTAGEFKDKLDLNKVSFKIIPVLNPYGYDNRRRTNNNNVDLNRQGDTEWESCFSDINNDGKYDNKDYTWKGNGGSFSEPEAATYKKIIDNAKNLYFTLDFHGNQGYQDNFLCIYPITAKPENTQMTFEWSSLLNRRIAGRYILRQDGDKKSIPYFVKKPHPDKLRPVLINSSAKNKYGFVLELTAGYKNTIATVMVSDIVCESILSIIEVYAPNPHSAQIADIKAGKLTTACASWWNPGKDNATQALQSAINSGARQVIIDNIGHDWIIDPVFLADNQEIIIDKDVTITARKGSFKGLRDSLFTAAGRKNIKIRGSGNSVLRMNKPDYLDSKQYKLGEWRHTLNLLSCENVEISNLILKSSGGDGIYIGVDYNNSDATKYCKNITIENVICDDHNRQGISVISAENLFIRKSIFKNTTGAAPMDGIDFEPNAASERLVNCIIEDCEFIDNANTGIELYLINLTDKSEPISITVKNSIISGNKGGIKISVLADKSKNLAVKGTLEFENCTISQNLNAPLTICNLTEDSLKVLLKNCTLETGASEPVSFICTNALNNNMGGIKFEQVTVADKIRRDPVCIKSWVSCKLKDISGTLRVINNGNSSETDIADLVKKYNSQNLSHKIPDTPAVMPASEKLTKQPGKIAMDQASAAPQLRGQVTLLQWAETGETVSGSITFIPIGNSPDFAEVKVKAPSGKTVKEIKIPFDNKENSCEFKAEERGLYRIETNPDREEMTYKPADGKYSILVPADGLNLRKQDCRLYFQVPAGVKNFRIDTCGCFAETFDATVLDQDMKEVARKDKVETPHTFEISRGNAANSEIWSIEFKNTVDDIFVKFYAPLIPIVSDSKEGLLITK